jgi:hypothetical protein
MVMEKARYVAWPEKGFDRSVENSWRKENVRAYVAAE